MNSRSFLTTFALTLFFGIPLLVNSKGDEKEKGEIAWIADGAIVTIRTETGYLAPTKGLKDDYDRVEATIREEPFSWRIEYSIQNEGKAPQKFMLIPIGEGWNESQSLMGGGWGAEKEVRAWVGRNLEAVDRTKWMTFIEGLVEGEKLAIVSLTNLSRGMYLADGGDETGLVLKKPGEEENYDEAKIWLVEELD